eukprot:c5084_g1_i1.p1 GENE.c5084_g1_i1~~c5084_g1_i1.p1  ORF type:complete len:353 (-),score=104.88 c5084_g1_i1:1-957(-)
MENPEMLDVWVNVIGRMLSVPDIVSLSMVNKWFYQISHNITKHQGYVQFNCAKESEEERNGHVALVANHWPSLKTLIVLESWDQENSPLVFEQIGVLSLELRHCESVTQFDFVNTKHLEEFLLHEPHPKLSQSACVSLEHVLVSCCALVSLDISYSLDENAEIEWVVNVLNCTPHLTHLNLTGNNIGPIKIQNISVAISKLPALTSLNLALNQLGIEGLQAIARHMHALRCITCLDLAYNNMGPKAGAVVAQIINHMTDIAELNLCWNWIEAEGTFDLIPSIARLQKMKHLDLSWNDLGEFAKQDVRLLLPAVNKIEL